MQKIKAKPGDKVGYIKRHMYQDGKYYYTYAEAIVNTVEKAKEDSYFHTHRKGDWLVKVKGFYTTKLDELISITERSLRFEKLKVNECFLVLAEEQREFYKKLAYEMTYKGV